MRSFLIGFFLAIFCALPAQSATRAPVVVPAARDFGAPMVKFSQSKYRQEHEVVIYKIADVKSSASSEEAFAIELGFLLNELTRVNGVENCAEFFRAKDGSGFAARIITMGSQAACPTLGRPFGEGYEATGGDIHSHIHTNRYRPNEVDRLFLNGTYGPRDTVSTHPPEFSPGDYKRPGYMVNAQDIKFQQGERQVRRVVKINEASIGTLVVVQSFSDDMNGLAPLVEKAAVASLGR